MESFEESISDLEDIDYQEICRPVVGNASVAAGILVPNGTDCTCDNIILLLSFKVVEGEEYEPIEVMVPPNSPLGLALLSGEFGRVCQERLDKAVDFWVEEPHND